MYLYLYLIYFDIQASLADISAEDFKKAVTSTPLAGQRTISNIMIHHRHFNSILIKAWIVCHST